jgi:hypothetical protein
MHDVYFGTNPTPGTKEYKGPLPMAMYFSLDPLVPGTTYYWRIDEIDAAGNKYTGNVWSATVMPLTAPCVPTGMNAGVCTTPWAVDISPRLAAPAVAVTRNENALTIGYIMVANRAARHDPDQEASPGIALARRCWLRAPGPESRHPRKAARA